MPSQILPKPNLPGSADQANQDGSVATDSPVSTPIANASSTPATEPIAAQTVFTQRPVQLRQSQTIPGGLSRENPGGTPPNMKVSAPDQIVSVAQTTLSPHANAHANTNNVQREKPVQMASRPMNPLSQMSLKPINEAKSDRPVAPTNSPSSVAATPTPTATTPPASSIDSSAGNDQEGKKVGLTLPKMKGKLPLPAIIGLAALLLIVLGTLVFGLLNKTKSSSSSSSKSTTATSSGTTTGEVTTITYWGLWEDSQILKEVITDFETANPTIKVDYRKQSHQDYRERLQQAIASGNGPDLFRYHVSWVPMLSTDLAAMPSTVMTTAEYKTIFYPTAYNNLQVGGQIVGIPLMYDGLALLYNKEMLKTANIEVPTTWAELRTAANKLTVPADTSQRKSGNITRAGLAIGNAGNVDHFADILALLIIQNGGNPSEVDTQYVSDAITFYTNFIKQDAVWSDRLANSTTAFARGDVAMIFAPSWRIHDIKNINPNLDFGVAAVPQLDSENPVAWATFWAEGVSSKSKNKDAAWTFLKYLSTPAVLRKFYNNASQYRSFGEIYPRTDMASELASDTLAGAYLSDAPLAKSWYMSSFTHDNGLNDQIIKYYEDAINAVLAGTAVDKALETAGTGITSVLSKYSSQ